MDNSALKVQYPQFRKYKNGKSYFKVLSKEQFEEIKYQPNKGWKRTVFNAKILPDRNFILDLTFHFDDFWDKIDEKEYETIKLKSSI